jgi:hypothetical protein
MCCTERGEPVQDSGEDAHEFIAASMSTPAARRDGSGLAPAAEDEAADGHPEPEGADYESTDCEGLPPA